MDIQLFIAIAGVVVGGIVWAIDIPTTKWENFPVPQRPKKTLLEILEQASMDHETLGTHPSISVTQPTTGTADHETQKPARTYAEAIKRAQNRSKTKVHARTSKKNPRNVS